MDVRLRFPFKRPIIVDDSWPLDGLGVRLELELEGNGDEVRAVLVTFRNQPVSFAPTIEPRSDGEVQADIRIRDPFSSLAASIVRRFNDYLNLTFDVVIDTDQVDIEYIAANETEKAQIALSKFGRSASPPLLRLSFGFIEQAFYAGDSEGDPSFVARLIQLARQSLFAHNYIDAFRYAFLLLEALYGDGKFKSVQLIDAFASSLDLRSAAVSTITDIQSDRYAGPTLRAWVGRYATPGAIFEHLVDRRGFYFHANVARPGAWHPDRHAEAEDLAAFTVRFASKIAQRFAEPMFTERIGEQIIANANLHGATRVIDVRFTYKDAHGFVQRGMIELKTPGTKTTHSLALRASKEFAEFAEVELVGAGATLVSATAYDRTSRTELWRVAFPQPPQDVVDERSTSIS